MTDKDEPTVDTAYGLKTPGDSRKLYAGWAQTYDQDFAARMDFLMPRHVARIFHEMNARGPVLDAGAGTGLVGEALAALGGYDMDALDITPEMLEVARSKGVYRDTIEADLLAPLPMRDGAYQSVVSSGTFTHGHVGPEALDELLRVAASGALFVLTIKIEHYQERGFADKFAVLDGQITEFETVALPIYGDRADQAHAADKGFVVTFRKA